jgi:hypothetical protein
MAVLTRVQSSEKLASEKLASEKQAPEKQASEKQAKFPPRVAVTKTDADQVAQDTLKRFPKTMAALAK